MRNNIKIRMKKIINADVNYLFTNANYVGCDSHAGTNLIFMIIFFTYLLMLIGYYYTISVFSIYSYRYFTVMIQQHSQTYIILNSIALDECINF